MKGGGHPALTDIKCTIKSLELKVLTKLQMFTRDPEIPFLVCSKTHWQEDKITQAQRYCVIILRTNKLWFIHVTQLMKSSKISTETSLHRVTSRKTTQ